MPIKIIPGNSPDNSWTSPPTVLSAKMQVKNPELNATAKNQMKKAVDSKASAKAKLAWGKACIRRARLRGKP